jgi:hypothetical protein
MSVEKERGEEMPSLWDGDKACQGPISGSSENRHRCSHCIAVQDPIYWWL